MYSMLTNLKKLRKSDPNSGKNSKPNSPLKFRKDKLIVYKVNGLTVLVINCEIVNVYTIGVNSDSIEHLWVLYN